MQASAVHLTDLPCQTHSLLSASPMQCISAPSLAVPAHTSDSSTLHELMEDAKERIDDSTGLRICTRISCEDLLWVLAWRERKGVFMASFRKWGILTQFWQDMLWTLKSLALLPGSTTCLQNEDKRLTNNLQALTINNAMTNCQKPNPLSKASY